MFTQTYARRRRYISNVTAPHRSNEADEGRMVPGRGRNALVFVYNPRMLPIICDVNRRAEKIRSRISTGSKHRSLTLASSTCSDSALRNISDDVPFGYRGSNEDFGAHREDCIRVRISVALASVSRMRPIKGRVVRAASLPMASTSKGALERVPLLRVSAAGPSLATPPQRPSRERTISDH